MRNKTTNGFLGMAFLTLAALSAGCAVDPREGSLGNATFAYRGSRGCAALFDDGCTVGSGALLVGVNESMEVRVPSSRDPRADLQLVSLAPEVVTASVSVSPDSNASTRSYRFRVSALSRGSARLDLRRGDGTLIDHVTVRVEEAAGIDIVNEDTAQGTLSSGAARFTVRMGSVGSITGFARDAAGRRLFGNDAVVWEVEGTEVAALSFGFTTGARVADDHVFVNPRAPGIVRAQVRAGSVTRALDIVVVP